VRLACLGAISAGAMVDYLGESQRQSFRPSVLLDRPCALLGRPCALLGRPCALLGRPCALLDLHSTLPPFLPSALPPFRLSQNDSEK